MRNSSGLVWYGSLVQYSSRRSPKFLMEASAFQIQIRPFPSIRKNQKKMEKVCYAYAAPNKVVLRRQILGLIGLNTIFLINAPSALLAASYPNPMDAITPDVLRTLKLPSGVIIQDIVDGQGQEAREGDAVKFNYVCRRSNGYFVHSTVNQFSGESSPIILPLDDQQMIEGLKEVLVGMKVGGKRRALIPPSVGYTSDTLQPVPEEFGPRRSLLSHAKEPLIFEVQLLKIL